MPDETFLNVDGTEEHVFGPEGKAADDNGYESEEGAETEDEVDEDKAMHHDTFDTTTFKAWEYADKYRKYINAVHWENAKVEIGISTSCVGTGPAAPMALKDIFPKGKISLLSCAEPDAGARPPSDNEPNW